jgi:glycosyltransferase involved in cell wall biosynthesis
LIRVLQLTTHLNIGGIGNYILTLSRSLKDRGLSVAVASSGGELEGELARCGIPHITLDMRTKSELSPKIVKSILRLRALVKQEQIDIIHAHTRVSQVVANFVSRMTRVPYVTTCHGFFKTRFRKIFDTWGVKVVAISDAVKEHLKGDLGVDEKRIELIYSGVDINRFSKEYSADEINVIKRSLGLNAGPVVGTIGRLSPVKGQKFLIQAMDGVLRKRPNVQALIIGDGPEEDALKKLARDLGIESKVRFLTSSLDTHKALSAMDVFVFPSVKEGLGIALLEAMAAGKVCVASDIGGIGNIIKTRYNGILTSVGDVRALSESILELLDDASLRKTMGERGVALVRDKFSLGSMSDKMIKLYQEVLKG